MDYRDNPPPSVQNAPAAEEARILTPLTLANSPCYAGDKRGVGPALVQLSYKPSGPCALNR
jgi:hypothetical protein